jgi:PIN domain nuclease of toxin-antitoxin system
VKRRFLLDTHILIWWIAAAKHLSKEQSRVIENAVHKGEKLGVCTISLLEIALLEREMKIKFRTTPDEVFEVLRSTPILEMIPINHEIASQLAVIGQDWDPMDRTIVATARVLGLHLLTVDGRIIESGLVPVVK